MHRCSRVVRTPPMGAVCTYPRCACAQPCASRANGAIGEREAFENCLNAGTFDVDRVSDFHDFEIEAAWRGWQARAALTAEKVAAEPFPYQRTFDAIAAATSVSAGRVAISVIDFRKAFGESQPAQTQVAHTSYVNWARTRPEDMGGCEIEQPAGWYCTRDFHHNGPCATKLLPKASDKG